MPSTMVKNVKPRRNNTVALNLWVGGVSKVHVNICVAKRGLFSSTLCCKVWGVPLFENLSRKTIPLLVHQVPVDSQNAVKTVRRNTSGRKHDDGKHDSCDAQKSKCRGPLGEADCQSNSSAPTQYDHT